MGKLGKILMTINPLSPVNWCVLCCVYFLIYKKFLKDNEVLDKVPYGASLTSCCSCMSSCFVIYNALCLFMPPEVPILGMACRL